MSIESPKQAFWLVPNVTNAQKRVPRCTPSCNLVPRAIFFKKDVFPPLPYSEKMRLSFPNYRQKDKFLVSCSRLQSMLIIYKERFRSILETGHVTQKLLPFLYWKFQLIWHDVGATPRIIKKMTNFWKIVSGSSQC